eukprot:TRINITY_DN12005_c0_g5_i4.p1 TRINITY_DN12005_c0_g5~~TRINITY_DN12005_c0_g5_i4.p1  ORF type:complete len:176 (+),score=27.18 TRINITY_DN12005_c0_g5_i4:620-1147(+)
MQHSPTTRIQRFSRRAEWHKQVVDLTLVEWPNWPRASCANSTVPEDQEQLEGILLGHVHHMIVVIEAGKWEASQTELSGLLEAMAQFEPDQRPIITLVANKADLVPVEEQDALALHIRHDTSVLADTFNLDVVAVLQSQKWAFMNPSYVFAEAVHRLEALGIIRSRKHADGCRLQ